MLMGLGIKAALMAVPGANIAVGVAGFVAKYWKPILLAASLAISFHLGVKHERKKSQVAQLRAQLAKVTAERNNIQTAADKAKRDNEQLEERIKDNATLIEKLQSSPPTGDCQLGDDALRRLRAIGNSGSRRR